MKVWIACLSLILTLALPTPLYAAGFNGYSVSADIVKVQGKPGETLNASFSVHNSTDKEVHVQIEVRDFERTETGITYLQDVPADRSVAKWSTAATPEHTLAPRATKKEQVQVTIPEHAQALEHVALISVRFLPADVQGTTRVATEILPVFYVLVTDANGQTALKKEWALADFGADRWLNPAALSFEVKNTGDMHLETQGKVRIENVLTDQHQQRSLPIVNLLPDASKRLGLNDLIEDRAPGLYKVQLSLSLDGGKRIETPEVTLVFLPWSYLGTAGGMLALLVLFLLYRSNRKKHQLQLMEQKGAYQS